MFLLRKFLVPLDVMLLRSAGLLSESRGDKLKKRKSHLSRSDPMRRRES